MSAVDRLKKLFGWGTAEEQRDATDDAIRWAFLIGLVFSLALIPWPLNTLVLVVVAAWFVGWLRHKSDVFNKLWNRVTLGR